MASPAASSPVALRRAAPGADTSAGPSSGAADSAGACGGAVTGAFVGAGFSPGVTLEALRGAMADFGECAGPGRRPCAPHANAPFSLIATCSRLRPSTQKLYAVAEREWHKFHTPRNVCLALVGEVGEVAELFQWRGEVPCGLDAGWSAKDREALGDELSDVLLYLVRLSDLCGVDLPAAAQRKMRKNAAKYPASLSRGRSDNYTAYAEAVAVKRRRHVHGPVNESDGKDDEREQVEPVALRRGAHPARTAGGGCAGGPSKKKGKGSRASRSR